MNRDSEVAFDAVGATRERQRAKKEWRQFLENQRHSPYRIPLPFIEEPKYIILLETEPSVSSALSSR
jgi:hypothetical protein